MAQLSGRSGVPGAASPTPTPFPSADPVLRAMWPDGEQSITEVTKRPLTTGTLFKNSIVALVENLACKVGAWGQPGTSLHPLDMSLTHLGMSCGSCV